MERIFFCFFFVFFGRVDLSSDRADHVHRDAPVVIMLYERQKIGAHGLRRPNKCQKRATRGVGPMGCADHTSVKGDLLEEQKRPTIC
jgi:hypothetical protein